MSSDCCGSSLQTGCKIIAVVHLIGTVLVGMALFPELSHLVQDAFDEEQVDGKILFALSLFAALFLLYLSLQFVLYSGAANRNLAKVKFWYIVSVVLYVFSIMCRFKEFAKSPEEFRQTLVPTVAGLVIQFYMLLVVWSFKKELEEERGQGYVEYSQKV